MNNERMEPTNVIHARVRQLRTELNEAEDALREAEARDAFNAKTQREQAEALAPAKAAKGDYRA